MITPYSEGTSCALLYDTYVAEIRTKTVTGAHQATSTQYLIFQATTRWPTGYAPAPTSTPSPWQTPGALADRGHPHPRLHHDHRVISPTLRSALLRLWKL